MSDLQVTATEEVGHEVLMAAFTSRLSTSGKSKLLTKEKYDRAVAYLLDHSTCTDAHFRHWVKERRFTLVDLPLHNLNTVLMIPRTNHKCDVARQEGELLRVVNEDEVYSVVKYVQCSFSACWL